MTNFDLTKNTVYLTINATALLHSNKINSKLTAVWWQWFARKQLLRNTEPASQQ